MRLELTGEVRLVVEQSGLTEKPFAWVYVLDRSVGPVELEDAELDRLSALGRKMVNLITGGMQPVQFRGHLTFHFSMRTVMPGTWVTLKGMNLDVGPLPLDGEQADKLAQLLEAATRLLAALDADQRGACLCAVQ